MDAAQTITDITEASRYLVPATLTWRTRRSGRAKR
jgi:hypothetical protein